MMEAINQMKDKLALVIIFFISLPLISVSFIIVPAFSLPLMVILFLPGSDKRKNDH